MNTLKIFTSFLIVFTLTLKVQTTTIKNNKDDLCPLRPPSNLKIEPSDGRLMLSWTSNEDYSCFVLHKIEVFLNGVHSQRIMTMRPNFPIDLPKPCVEVRVLVSSTDDSGIESDIISATYRTETPTEFGTVENRWWLVDRTRIIVSYFPPYPYENCNFQYEMYYTFMDTDTVIKNTTSTDLIAMLNYVEEGLLCRYITMHLTPILNGIRGETWEEIAVADKFIPNPGPVSSLNAEVTDVLTITWTPPADYEACTVIYRAEIIEVLSGQMLGSFTNIETQWIFDFASEGLFCVNVAVRVTSDYNGVSGGTVTKHVKLGPPPNGAC